MACTLVLDNGAYSAKIGFCTEAEPRVVPNCVIKAKTVRSRIFIGDQIEECKDLSGLYYLLAFQKGYLVNWEIERQVWDYMFCKEGFTVNFDNTGVIITEPYFNFRSVQEAISEILFEDYLFQFIYRCNGGYLSQHKHCKESGGPALCCLVVDSGYSFTHITPYYSGRPVKQAIRRIDVGGKVLTNHLKEVISYRQLMVMDETHVVNQMKEDTCYVSTDFWGDMELAKKKGKENAITRDYVLPDYTHIKRGYVRPPEETTGVAKDAEQIIRMNNERFAIPEILFHPSDVGIHEMGIAEAIIHSINGTPPELHPHLYQNIVLTGGNCCIPGFKERLYKEVRSLAPDEFDLEVHLPENPITYAWQGGILLPQLNDFSQMVVTRQLYDEYGTNICLEMFDV